MTRVAILFLSALLPAVTLAANGDNRAVLSLKADQHRLVLQEMRELLAGSQKIVDALANGDFDSVAQAARAMGTGMAQSSEHELHHALPERFMQLGMSMHQGFDRLADDAQSTRNAQNTLKELAENLSKCVACHKTYRLATRTTSSSSTSKSGPPTPERQ